MADETIDKTDKWIVYLIVGAIAFVVNAALAGLAKQDWDDPPINWRNVVFSTVIFVCVVSWVSDLWRRFVREDYVGLLLASFAVLALRFWMSSPVAK